MPNLRKSKLFIRYINYTFVLFFSLCLDRCFSCLCCEPNQQSFFFFFFFFLFSIDLGLSTSLALFRRQQISAVYSKRLWWLLVLAKLMTPNSLFTPTTWAKSKRFSRQLSLSSLSISVFVLCVLVRVFFLVCICVYVLQKCFVEQ